jgi:DNA topoisomerase-3
MKGLSVKTCVLAEKPSQAREFYLPLIERLSGEKFQRKNSYYESASWYLTWFFGHLFQALEPVEYDARYKFWRLEDLPILPEPVRYRYKDSTAQKQGETILELCRKSDLIVCATDPDREGEGIFRGFYEYHKIDKPVKRLWAVSLTDKDLNKAWSAMKPSTAYDNLARARELRAGADWLVGMNVSRAYSVKSGVKLPIGRVLTATLALIVARDYEVENYRESYLYSLTADWGGLTLTFYDENGAKFEKKEYLERIRSLIQGKNFRQESFKAENRTENPPRTYALADLQKDANKVHGYPLDKTLAIAQRLYEKKVITYPRTDSPYLPESDLNEYYTLLDKQASDKEKTFLRPTGEKPPCVKNTDSAHTALIPTGEQASLTSEEANVYELVRSRFVTAFMRPRLYMQYSLVVTDGAGHCLRARFTFDTDKGFKAYKSARVDDDQEKSFDDEPEQSLTQDIDRERLANLQQPLASMEIKQTRKSKPQYFTAATLLTAMQNCGRMVEDEQARQTLKEIRGIGTAATQATYPVNLQRYGYIITKGKHYISTPKGRSLIASVHPDVKSPELTADWEYRLQQVEKGAYPAQQFDEEMRAYVRKLVEEVSGMSRFALHIVDKTEPDPALLQCPRCNRYLKDFDWGVACLRECGFKVGKTIAGKKITDAQINRLLTKGRTDVIKGFTSKAGKSFDAILELKGGDVKFCFDIPEPTKKEPPVIECPLCKAPLKTGENGAACRCGFRAPRVVAGKELSDAQLKKLLTTGATDRIDGFSQKSGKKFKARLVIKDKRITFDFNFITCCPKCGGELAIQGDTLKCRAKDCDFTISRLGEDGKKLTDKQLAQRLEQMNLNRPA